MKNKSISTKDWDRMLALVLKCDDGETAAKLIKDKNKAIVRFVAGLKLANQQYQYDKTYFGKFSKLRDKAIELGATSDEIKDLYDTTDVPAIYLEKISNLSGKKLSNSFVGDISRAVLDMGFDIVYLPHSGYAITMEGKHAMEKNGRKWTIGYKSQILIKDKNENFIFDAITDEGDGPTYYVLDQSSSSVFNTLNTWKRYGKHEFISKLKFILASNK